MIDWLTTLEAAGRNREKLDALGKLAAGLAHELNNPVSVVTLALEHSALALSASAVPRDAVEALRALARSNGSQA